MNPSENNRHSEHGPLHYISLLLLPLLAALYSWQTALALPTDFTDAIDIEAEYVEFDRSNNTSIYRGNVRLTRGSIKLNANEVRINQDDDGHINAVALGEPATYQQLRAVGEEPIKASAKRLEFRSDKEVLELINDATIRRGIDVLTSDRIRYNMAENRILAGGAAGGDGVKITIQPRSN